MNTPICDFVRRYAQSETLRLHMPGHKGSGALGIEQLDITEIDGADNLYEAAGIIRQSEKNAGSLFECDTFYSTEGSSQCIRAMLYLALLYAKQIGRKPIIAAGRNAHKTFLSAVALLNMDVMWLYPTGEESYLSCFVDPQQLDELLQRCAEKPAAVYVTSPDYLGGLSDISKIAAVCHDHGVLLLVDNAHGAYLRFLPESMHPIQLGADLCCSSAHKTLPVLTGGAYLHISPMVPQLLVEQGKNALALFGSTSPSYLILQSLDAANAYLAEYPRKLQEFLPWVAEMKEHLVSHGYILYGDETLKITVLAKPYGYTGGELAQLLYKQNIVCEFSDPDYLVLMLTPETGKKGLRKLEKALLDIPHKEAIQSRPPLFCKAEKVMSVRDAVFSPCEKLPIAQCEGKVLAASTVSCPPAVPILVCGERIDAHAIECFEYYGIESCVVICDE